MMAKEHINQRIRKQNMKRNSRPILKNIKKYANYAKDHPFRTFMSHNPYQHPGSVVWNNLILPLLIVGGCLGSILLCAKWYRSIHPYDPIKSKRETLEETARSLPPPQCSCGERMVLKQANKCYDDDEDCWGVDCDVCSVVVRDYDDIYHCANKKHDGGYDLCLACFVKQNESGRDE
eukprot:1102384_1